MGSFFSKNKNPNSIYEPKAEKNLLGTPDAIYSYNALAHKNFNSLSNKLGNSHDISAEYFNIPIAYWVGIYSTVYSQSELEQCLIYFRPHLPYINKTKKCKSFRIRFEIKNGQSQLYINGLHEKSFVNDDFLLVPALTIEDMWTFLSNNICKASNVPYIKYIGINSSAQNQYRNTVGCNLNTIKRALSHTYAQSIPPMTLQPTPTFDGITGLPRPIQYYNPPTQTYVPFQPQPQTQSMDAPPPPYEPNPPQNQSYAVSTQLPQFHQFPPDVSIVPVAQVVQPSAPPAFASAPPVPSTPVPPVYSQAPPPIPSFQPNSNDITKYNT